MDNLKDTDSEQPSTENPVTEVRVNENKLNAYIEKLKLEQNLPMALMAGLGASLIGALLWATITVVTEYQIGYMAIAVGFMVGYAVRYLGKGLDQIYGIIGAVFALLGCLMGNFFSIVGFAANELGLGYLEALNSIDLGVIPEIMGDTFSPIDILFYGIAIYEGYKFAFRPITEEEILEQAAEKVTTNNEESKYDSLK